MILSLNPQRLQLFWSTLRITTSDGFQFESLRFLNFWSDLVQSGSYTCLAQSGLLPIKSVPENFVHILKRIKPAKGDVIISADQSARGGYSHIWAI